MENPKDTKIHRRAKLPFQIKIRMGEQNLKELDEISKATGMEKATIVRNAITEKYISLGL